LATNETPRLNRATLEFIRDGAEEPNRHRRLFSATANLAEFSCPPPLAHTLLSEPALDSGLSPSDVRRQIECGLKHTGPIPTQAPPPAAEASAGADTNTLQKQLAAPWNAPPPDAGNAWESEPDRQAAGTHEFPFGANATGPYGEQGGRR